MASTAASSGSGLDLADPGMTADVRRSKWFILLWWVLASIVGYSIGFPVGLAVGQSLVWGWLAGGAIAAVLQWYVLRPHVAQASWWVAASLVGLAIGAGISFLFSQYIVLLAGLTATLAWVGGTVGLGVGMAQWIVLRRHFRQAGWWVLASVAGYTLGVLAAVNAPVAIPVAGALVFGPEFGGLVGVISGAFTGAVMVWLLGINPDS